VHRQAQQAHAEDRPAAADGGGHREAEGSHAQQPGGRVVASQHAGPLCGATGDFGAVRLVGAGESQLPVMAALLGTLPLSALRQLCRASVRKQLMKTTSRKPPSWAISVLTWVRKPSSRTRASQRSRSTGPQTSTIA